MYWVTRCCFLFRETTMYCFYCYLLKIILYCTIIYILNIILIHLFKHTIFVCYNFNLAPPKVLWVIAITFCPLSTVNHFHISVLFNATFNNISVISWRSVLLVEETTDLSQVTDKLYHMLYRVHLAWAGFKLTMLVAISTNCMGSYKFNYQTITTTMALFHISNT